MAARTITTELERSKPIQKYFGAERSVKSISSEDALSYVRARAGAGIANATINRELDVLRGILKRARLWTRFADDVKPLPLTKSIGRAMSHAEKLRLLKVAASRPEWQTARTAMILALNTTMRGCELKGLQWRDVDLMERTLTIRVSKTDAGLRTIPLNAQAWAAILELRERSKSLLGAELDPDWYVFFRNEGGFRPEPDKAACGWRTSWRNLTSAIECPDCSKLQAPGTTCSNGECGADFSQGHKLDCRAAFSRSAASRHHRTQ